VERSGLERLQLDSHAVADLYTLIHSGYFTMVIFENDGNRVFFRGCMGRRWNAVRFGMLELDWPVADLYTLIHSGHLRICRQVKSTLGCFKTIIYN